MGTVYDGYISKYVNRKMSEPMARLLAKTQVTPNQKIDSDYLHGHLTVEQSNKLQFVLIKEPKERLQAFVRQHIELRPGFVEFIRYCQESAIPFAIVSSGLDFYIEPVRRVNTEKELFQRVAAQLH